MLAFSPHDTVQVLCLFRALCLYRLFVYLFVPNTIGHSH